MLAKVDEPPTQADNVPVLAEDNELTVYTVVAKQPVDKVYVMFEVPTETAATEPVALPTVATAGVELLQVPPEVVLVSVEPLLIHEDNVPEIEAGTALTVKTAPVAQPPDNV